LELITGNEVNMFSLEKKVYISDLKDPMNLFELQQRITKIMLDDEDLKLASLVMFQIIYTSMSDLDPRHSIKMIEQISGLSLAKNDNLRAYCVCMARIMDLVKTLPDSSMLKICCSKGDYLIFDTPSNKVDAD